MQDNILTSSLSQATISPYETWLHRQYLGSLGSYVHSPSPASADWDDTSIVGDSGAGATTAGVLRIAWTVEDEELLLVELLLLDHFLKRIMKEIIIEIKLDCLQNCATLYV